MMIYNDYFWKASVDELKKGYYYDEKAAYFTCLICGITFDNGTIYPLENKLYSAEKAISVHICSEHGSVFDFFLQMSKTYTGLTEHQKDLMKLFYNGLSDKDIVGLTEATSTSTIRNQRFTLREKYKQAKIIVAMTELLEERIDKIKMSRLVLHDNNSVEELTDIHRTATMLDERYVITQSEKNEVLSRYFDSNNKLLIKAFPAREKKKIIILQHLSEEFERNKKYTEKEVNEIIKNFYEDIPTVRRYFIEYGFLDRSKDGKEYWVKS